MLKTKSPTELKSYIDCSKQIENDLYQTIEDLAHETYELKNDLKLHFMPTMFYSIIRAMRKGFNGTGVLLEQHEKNRKILYTSCYRYGVPKKELTYRPYKLFLKSFMRNPIDKYDRSTLWLNMALYTGCMFESYHFLSFYEKELYKIKKSVDKRKSELEKIIEEINTK